MPEPCGATGTSASNPGHVHTCTGTHSLGDHKCSDPACRKWFWKDRQSDDRKEWE